MSLRVPIFGAATIAPKIGDPMSETSPSPSPNTDPAPGAVERHRRKWWVLGIGLLALAFYRSLQPLPAGPSGTFWPPDGNALPEVVLARLAGLACIAIGAWGSKRHLDRLLRLSRRG
jgi:hypothetical protein